MDFKISINENFLNELEETLPEITKVLINNIADTTMICFIVQSIVNSIEYYKEHLILEENK